MYLMQNNNRTTTDILSHNLQQKHWTAPILPIPHLIQLNNYIQLVIKLRNQYRFSTEQKQEINTNNFCSILNTIIIQQQLPLRLI
ncbi:unnamed protein product [Ambrosiozyma monospora]|uniref:Unnamed protein product n=1 Tax=Ambrosiozyma monospora TaxID=43982 RepID=A0ACB5T048_AMBMO|nr:unnamed protein product [Ambrosiozyma monospora]